MRPPTRGFELCRIFRVPFVFHTDKGRLRREASFRGRAAEIGAEIERSAGWLTPDHAPVDDLLRDESCG